MTCVHATPPFAFIDTVQANTLGFVYYTNDTYSRDQCTQWRLKPTQKNERIGYPYWGSVMSSFVPADGTWCEIFKVGGCTGEATWCKRSPGMALWRSRMILSAGSNAIGRLKVEKLRFCWLAEG